MGTVALVSTGTHGGSVGQEVFFRVRNCGPSEASPVKGRAGDVLR